MSSGEVERPVTSRGRRQQPAQSQQYDVRASTERPMTSRGRRQQHDSTDYNEYARTQQSTEDTDYSVAPSTGSERPMTSRGRRQRIGSQPEVDLQASGSYEGKLVVSMQDPLYKNGFSERPMTSRERRREESGYMAPTPSPTAVSQGGEVNILRLDEDTGEVVHPTPRNQGNIERKQRSQRKSAHRRRSEPVPHDYSEVAMTISPTPPVPSPPAAPTPRNRPTSAMRLGRGFYQFSTSTEPPWERETREERPVSAASLSHYAVLPSIGTPLIPHSPDGSTLQHDYPPSSPGGSTLQLDDSPSSPGGSSFQYDYPPSSPGGSTPRPEETALEMGEFLISSSPDNIHRENSASGSARSGSQASKTGSRSSRAGSRSSRAGSRSSRAGSRSSRNGSGQSNYSLKQGNAVSSIENDQVVSGIDGLKIDSAENNNHKDVQTLNAQSATVTAGNVNETARMDGAVINKTPPPKPEAAVKEVVSEAPVIPSTVSVFKPLACEVAPPPEPGEKEERVLLAVKLPTGLRVQHQFRPTSPLRDVIRFAESVGALDFSRCELVCHGPPLQVFRDLDQTIVQSKIQNRTVLHIQMPDEET